MMVLEPSKVAKARAKAMKRIKANRHDRRLVMTRGERYQERYNLDSPRSISERKRYATEPKNETKRTTRAKVATKAKAKVISKGQSERIEIDLKETKARATERAIATNSMAVNANSGTGVGTKR